MDWYRLVTQALDQIAAATEYALARQLDEEPNLTGIPRWSKISSP